MVVVYSAVLVPRRVIYPPPPPPVLGSVGACSVIPALSHTSTTYMRAHGCLLYSGTRTGPMATFVVTDGDMTEMSRRIYKANGCPEKGATYETPRIVTSLPFLKMLPKNLELRRVFTQHRDSNSRRCWRKKRLKSSMTGINPVSRMPVCSGTHVAIAKSTRCCNAPHAGAGIWMCACTIST